MAHTLQQIQTALQGLGIYKGDVDGLYGPQTKTALTAFQRINKLPQTGVYSDATEAALFPAAIEQRLYVPPTNAPAPAQKWPRQSECNAFYGPPGSAAATAGTCQLPIAFRIAWNKNQRVTKFNCHAKVAASLTSIFAQAVPAYGEAKFRQLGLDLFGGCYNNRPMRGGSHPSMHSYGIAVDLDPENNQLKWPKPKATFSHPEYEPFWKIVEAHGAVSLGRVANFDWMHFQFARL